LAGKEYTSYQFLKPVLISYLQNLNLNVIFLQVLNAAWDSGTPVARENSLACHDRVGYNKMLESVKFRNDPDRKHLSSFAYSRLVPALMEGHNIVEFERFVKKLHGNSIGIFVFSV